MNSRINWNLLVNAMLSGFLTGAAGRIFVISLPTLAHNLGTDITGMSWALIAYPLATVSLSLIFGRVGDLYGRQSVFAVGFAVFTTASFLCGFSQNIFHLFLFRIFQGVGAAMTQAQGRALAMEAVPEDFVGRAQGWVTVAHQVGFLLGPGLGGLIIDYIHWRGVFFFLVPIGAASTLVTWREMRKSTIRRVVSGKRADSSVDYLGSAYLIGTTVTLIAILDRRVTEAIPAGWTLLLTLGFVGFILSFLVRERTTSSPILDLSLFKIRMFAFATLCLLMVSVSHSMTSFVFPFYLQEVLSLSPSFIGLLYLAPPLCVMAFSPVGGHLSDKVGPTLPATAGLGLATLAFLIGVFLRPDSHWWAPILVLCLAGAGDGLFSAPNHAAMITAVPSEHRGVATGAVNMMFGLGGVFGFSLGSFVLTQGFRFYTGDALATPTPANPAPFVAALNATFLVISIIALAATFFSLIRGKSQTAPPGPLPHLSPSD